MNLRAVILLLFFLAFARAHGAELSETLSLEGVEQVRVHNLAGRVELREAAPGDARIEWTAHAAESDELPALKVTNSAGTAVVRVQYDESTRHYVYPSPEYRRLKVDTRYDGRKVTVRDSGRGVEAWMDMRVFLAPGQELEYRLIAGSLDAEGVDADLELRTEAGRVFVRDSEGRLLADTRSGPVEVFGHRGSVIADTGSGMVTVEDLMGDVNADTGSGAVRLSGVSGEVRADTGSGRVELTDVNSERITVDTGSGGVRMERVAGSIRVETGSGGVRARDFTAGREVNVDTGSGSVELSGDLSAVRRLRIDTGSGSVDLATSAPPSLRLVVDTGSGGISVELPETDMVRSERRRLEAEIAGGEGSGVIDTGSGSVRLTRLDRY